MSRAERVIVITGLGGMGLAVAQRLGPGATVVLADIDETALTAASDALSADGYQVVGHVTDVGDSSSVTDLAESATRLGRVEVLVHTAGLSPVQAEVEAILRVDLLGTALMLEAFAPVIVPGSAGVFISSMAGRLVTLEPDLEDRLARLPVHALLDQPELAGDVLTDPGMAYGIAKRANQVRVRSASVAWGMRGARVNSISPGVISTPMGMQELAGASGEFMREVIAGTPTGRVGTPHDIASVVEFLLGPGASFITGTDVLVDGGAVASLLTTQR